MFALFIPDCLAVTPAVLQGIGCAGLFERMHPPAFADCVSGPAGLRGKLVFSDVKPGASELPPFPYDPALQRWIECDGYWVGVWKDRPATPEYLLREMTIDGHEVILRDGNAWVIPMVEYLPQRITYDRETRQEKQMPFAEDAEFIARANELFAYFISDDFQQRVAIEKVVHIENGLAFAAAALAKNYRVNRDLVDALELIGEVEAFAVARIVTGLSLVDELEAQKKTAL